MAAHTPLIRCSEIRDELAQRDPHQVWSQYLGQIATLQAFWRTATNLWAQRVELPPAKLSAHIAAVDSAVELMDGWRMKRITYVKARRNEIDSAIGFLRNRALDRTIGSLALAPVARNVAGELRACLYIATGSYSDDQFPTVVAQSVYGLAFVRTLFPVDTSNLAAYMPAGLSIHAQGGELDNFHVMLQAGAVALGLEEALAGVNGEAARIWRGFDHPAPFELDPSLWTVGGGEWSADLHHRQVRAFH